MLSTNEKTTKGSLMKKTKAELVSIILRKDSIDKEKQAVIDELHKKAVTKFEYETLKDSYLKEVEKVKTANEEIDTLNSSYEKLDTRNAELAKINKDLKDALDENASIFQETKIKLKFWRNFAIAYVLITIMIVVLKAIM